MFNKIINITLIFISQFAICQKNDITGVYKSKKIEESGLVVKIIKNDSFMLSYGGDLVHCTLEGKWKILNNKSVYLVYPSPKENKIFVSEEEDVNHNDSLVIAAITEDSLPMPSAIFKVNNKYIFSSNMAGKVYICKNLRIKTIKIYYITWDIPVYKVKNSIADKIYIKVIHAETCEKVYIKKNKILLRKNRIILTIPTLSKKRIHLFKVHN